MKDNVFQVLSSGSCCGCGACVNACPVDAIAYGEDTFGFTVPTLDNEKCINCKKCVGVCPALKQELSPSIKAYAGLNRNKEILIKSSSGGIFSELALDVLSDGGVVFGATLDDSFKVRHIKIEKAEELGRITRSKYVQSFMGDVFAQIKNELLQGRRVLFCGTPCQASAVRNFIGQRSSERLLIVDVVCHGVPSQRFFDSYLEFLSNSSGRELESYTFRHKTDVDNGMDWYAAYKLKGRSLKVRNWPEDSYNYLYMTSAIYRESCYECKYATGERAGDVTLCDYWGWEKSHGEFSYRDAVSAILVNTEKGDEAVDRIIERDVLRLYPTSPQSVRDGNGCLREPSKRHGDREKILSRWKNDGYAPIDADFKKRHRKQRLKYAIMRRIPKKLIYMLKKG